MAAAASRKELRRAISNHDGKLDLATANLGENTISILLGDGAGGFAPAVTYPTGSLSPYSIETGDMNNDGELDLVTANASINGNISVLKGDGAGGFTTYGVFPTGTRP